MAEEGTLGQARASHVNDDEEPSKEELQRRMEEARESITQTVTEIKETVTNQYYSVKETVSDALDWRHHFRQRPIAFSVGALSVGFLVGYGVAGALKGDGGDGGSTDYSSYEDSDVFARTGATPSRYEDEQDEESRYTVLPEHSYAAQSATGNLSEPSEYAGGSSSEEEQKPGLFERFKETSAYDRLQSEVSSLGDRFIDQLSSTAQHVVLPALFNKIKELFGVDLSNQQGQGGERAAQTGASSSARITNAQAAGASASRASSGSSYATSENRGYGAQPSEGSTGSRGTTDSVLDLDR
jgi:hypothetical protein